MMPKLLSNNNTAVSLPLDVIHQTVDGQVHHHSNWEWLAENHMMPSLQNKRTQNLNTSDRCSHHHQIILKITKMFLIITQND